MNGLNIAREIGKSNQAFQIAFLLTAGARMKQIPAREMAKPTIEVHQTPANAGREVQSKEDEQPSAQHNGYANEFHHRRLGRASGLAFEGLDLEEAPESSNHHDRADDERQLGRARMRRMRFRRKLRSARP